MSVNLPHPCSEFHLAFRCCCGNALPLNEIYVLLGA